MSRSSAAADATSVCSFYSTQTPIFVLHPGKRCLFKSPKTTFVNVSADTDATLLISGSAFIRNEDTALIKLSISFPLKWVFIEVNKLLLPYTDGTELHFFRIASFVKQYKDGREYACFVKQNKIHSIIIESTPISDKNAM